ncbi:hypothetical protein SERLADRAFT_398580 [Serpula lacrymans var. lacrymans S7.9]|nr:uncharacterized protein SERLADRAFT_398580 [Serpula lacrymans var. lacrymans S7.9]EGO21167.1 hypothetical protein SERLADRAFT_398580 [Serpula lacrymans var. lacrymans S7.9]
MSASVKSGESQRILSEPRPSASLVVINERNEILLVHRNPKARAFGGIHVFPGGNYDAKQDSSLAMTAIRETFEESGVLFASSSNPIRLSSTVINEARKAVHEQKLDFQSFLSKHHFKVDIGALLPFTIWVTPPIVPRRFRTQFFVAFLPGSSSTGFSGGDKEDQLPTPDGAQEVIAARFVNVNTAMEEFRAGKISFLPPQYYIVETLRSLLTGHINTQDQRETVTRLSRGGFGQMVINPRVSRVRDEEGREIFAYEGDETRGGPKGRLHRSLVRRKGDIFHEIHLKRNFDIFTDIQAVTVMEPGPKL